MLLYATVLASALLAAYLLTPLARRVALRLGVVDKPDVRKQHRDPVPYLGGAAVFGGMVAGLIALLVLARNPARSIAQLDTKTIALVAGAAVMFGLGLWDDLRHMRARNKLLVQLVVATAMWFCGLRVDGIRISEHIHLDFGVFSLPITVLWIAGVTNAINFIDGLDGLAAGIGAIAASAIGIVAFQGQHYATAALLAILAGSLLGFLPHNRHPARIFLGDAGSLMIGFVLATSAVATSNKSTAFASVGAPFLALGLPILDLCFAVMRRWIERRGLFSADRNHIHHRLLSLGYSHGRTVQLLWAESAIMTALALVMLYGGTENWQRLFGFGLVFAGHVWFFRITGAVRLRESYRAFRSAAARMRMSKWHQKCYDELDLHFRSVASLEDWWHAVVLAGQRLGIARMQLRMPAAAQERSWQDRELANLTPDLAGRVNVRMSLPIPCGQVGVGFSGVGPLGAGLSGHPAATAHLEIERPSASLEECGQATEVLGRLLDRHGLDAVLLPTRGKATAVAAVRATAH